MDRQEGPDNPGRRSRRPPASWRGVHPTEVDEGVTLTGRYRVTELLAEAPGDEGAVAQTWRAIDEVLSRSVVVYVLSAHDSRAAHVLEASRRAATISDVRFLRVLDALEEDGLAYVVREWVDGRTLSTLLAESALPPRDAGLVVREVADALARAHGQELYHERLDPDSVIITDGGTVKIVGLATHAALNGTGLRPAPAPADASDGPLDVPDPSTDPDLDPDTDGSVQVPSGASGPDPVRADTLGLGRLLYATLTARWPTGPRSGLQGGPRAADGTLLSPRQCRAGVPRALDEITERILSDRPRHGSPLQNPREIVDALTGTVGSTPPEGVLSSLRPPATGQSFVASSPPPRNRQQVDDRTAQFERPAGPPAQSNPRPPGYPPQPGYQQGYQGYPPNGAGSPPPARPMAGYRQPRRPASRWQVLAGVLVALVLLSGVAILGFQLIGQSSGGDDGREQATQDAGGEDQRKQKQPPKPVQIADASDYDPPPNGNGEEHADEVENAYDDDPSTAWTTMSYWDDAEYGGTKEGVGIWFDLGETTRVRELELSFYGQGPTDADIMAAPKDAGTAPESLDEWKKIGTVSDAAGDATVKIEGNVRTRYVLVFLTKIPPEGGEWRGGITNTVIKS